VARAGAERAVLGTKNRSRQGSSDPNRADDGCEEQLRAKQISA